MIIAVFFSQCNEKCFRKYSCAASVQIVILTKICQLSQRKIIISFVMCLIQHYETFAFQCKDACAVCTYCGGFQRLLCPICHGSKRSVHRNEFTVEFVALKCAKCDVFGMIRCPHCWRNSTEGIHVHLLKSFFLFLTTIY